MRRQDAPGVPRTKLWGYPPRRSNLVYDLKFSRKGVKRWAVKYRYGQYRCSGCHAELTFYQRVSRYGPGLRAFLVYLVIDLLLSNRKAAEHASLLFDLRLTKSVVGQMQSRDSREIRAYLPGHPEANCKGKPDPCGRDQRRRLGWGSLRVGVREHDDRRIRLLGVEGVSDPGKPPGRIQGCAGFGLLRGIRFGAVSPAEMPHPPDARHQRGPEQEPIQRGTQSHRLAIRRAAPRNRRNG